MNTINIDEIAALVADENQYNLNKGHKKVSEPSFIFFDDDREVDPMIAWFREDLLDFEEWSAARKKYDEDLPDMGTIEYLDRQDARRRANWLIGWHKRRPANNDNWRRIIMPLIDSLDNPEIGKDCLAIVKGIAEALPEAPRAIGGTIFVNPDGTKRETAGTAMGTAKASYINRHKLKDEFVSVDRVQKEGEKFSKIVIGIRKTSDQTPSRYYDPNPKWTERKVGYEWEKQYLPSACNLFLLEDSKVMSGGSHRLTVREFEQAIIAGANIVEDENDLCAFQFENPENTDDRTIAPENGYGKNRRHEEAFTEEEAYLFQLLRGAGMADACELMQCRDQSENMLKDYFWKSDDSNPMEDEGPLGELLRMVEEHDTWTTKSKLKTRINKVTGERVAYFDKVAVPPRNAEPMLPFVLNALTGIED